MNVMQNMDNLMKPISSEIKILYDALLVKRGVPLKESLLHFIKKLKDKNQIEQQQKQAFHAISIFSGIKNTDQDEIGALKNKTENISTKKTCIKSNRGMDKGTGLKLRVSGGRQVISVSFPSGCDRGRFR